MSNLERSITKDILKNELRGGGVSAIELLYNRYSGMLYSYILQFVPDKKRAETLLVDIFSGLHSRLQELFESSLGIYCWLQVETRKMILDHAHRHKLSAGSDEVSGIAAVVRNGAGAGSPTDASSDGGSGAGEGLTSGSGLGSTAAVAQEKGDYYRLLEDASPEQRWIFRELYICGRRPEELAMELEKDTAYVAGLLKESLLIISKKLG